MVRCISRLLSEVPAVIVANSGIFGNRYHLTFLSDVGTLPELLAAAKNLQDNREHNLTEGTSPRNNFIGRQCHKKF